MNTVDDILARLRKAIGTQDRVALHEPAFGQRESELVQDCLSSGWVSSVGKYVDQLEEDLARFTGAKHAVAVVNGTAALHVALLLAGVQAGDEVLCPALSFVATANAIHYCHAHPHFVDVSPRTWGMCADRLREHWSNMAVRRNGQWENRVTGRRIGAVLPMHTFGVPVELDPLVAFCKELQLPLIEDAAESLGSFYRKKHTGNFGRLAAISFNGNKIITAGGGGAILTNDSQLAKRAKHITTTAKVPHPWEFHHDEFAFNYRMPNLNAALAVAQMERLHEFIQAKRELQRRYVECFTECTVAEIYCEPEECESNYWLIALRLNGDATLRDEILQAANATGIATRPIWTLLCDLPMYANCPQGDLTISRELERCVISVPSSPKLALNAQVRVAA